MSIERLSWTHDCSPIELHEVIMESKGVPVREQRRLVEAVIKREDVMQQVMSRMQREAKADTREGVAVVGGGVSQGDRVALRERVTGVEDILRELDAHVWVDEGTEVNVETLTLQNQVIQDTVSRFKGTGGNILAEAVAIRSHMYELSVDSATIARVDNLSEVQERARASSARHALKGNLRLTALREQEVVLDSDRSQLALALSIDAVGHPHSEEHKLAYAEDFESHVTRFLDARNIDYLHEKKLQEVQGWRLRVVNRAYLASLGEEDIEEKGVLTPDTLLLDDVYINGHPVNWIDAKGTYGAYLDPEAYYAESLVHQARRYTDAWGPGAFIFRRGCCTGLVRRFKLEGLPVLVLDAGEMYHSGSKG
jgi:hypothetical protein